MPARSSKNNTETETNCQFKVVNCRIVKIFLLEISVAKLVVVVGGRGIVGIVVVADAVVAVVVVELVFVVAVFGLVGLVCFCWTLLGSFWNWLGDQTGTKASHPNPTPNNYDKIKTIC